MRTVAPSRWWTHSGDIIESGHGMIPKHRIQQAQSIVPMVAIILATAGVGLWVLSRAADRALKNTLSKTRFDSPSPQLINLIATVKLIKGVTEFIAKHPAAARPSSPIQPDCSTPPTDRSLTESHCLEQTSSPEQKQVTHP